MFKHTIRIVTALMLLSLAGTQALAAYRSISRPAPRYASVRVKPAAVPSRTYRAAPAPRVTTPPVSAAMAGASRYASTAPAAAVTGAGGSRYASTAPGGGAAVQANVPPAAGVTGGSRYASTAPRAAALGVGGVAAGVAIGAVAGDASLASASQASPDKANSKSQSSAALASYKQEQAKFKQGAAAVTSTPASGATYRPAFSRTAPVNHATYLPRRTAFYGGQGWGMPAWGYGSYSQFGVWDAMALWYMLDHISDHRYASMYYNHYNDPGMQAWRREADRLAADNSELRAKLAEADRQRAALSGRPVDPAYLPADMKDLALHAGEPAGGQPQPVAQAAAPAKKGSHWLLWTVLGLAIACGCGYLVYRVAIRGRVVKGGASW